MARILRLPVVLVAMCLLNGLSARPACGQALSTLVERDVQTLPRIEGMVGHRVVISACGDHLAYVRRDPDKKYMRVVCDGKAGKGYLDIITASVQLSCDGKRLAYVAGNVVVLDGVEDGCSCPSLDPGVNVGGHDNPWYPVFSPDGMHFVHVKRTREGKEEFVCRDGRAEGGFASVGTPVFSPDSKHLAYAAAGWQVARQGDHWDSFIVIDGMKGPEFRSCQVGSPVWAPDSKSYAHTIFAINLKSRRGDPHVSLAWGSLRVGPCNKIEGLTFSTDSKRLAWKALGGNKWCLFINDRNVTSGFAEMGKPVFSPDGKHWACAAKDGGKWFVILDGKKGAAYDSVCDPVFTPDSKHMAYRAKLGDKTTVVCDGKEAGNYDEVNWLGFSSDSKHLAVVVARYIYNAPNSPVGTERFVVIDGADSRHQRWESQPEIIVPERFERPYDPEKRKEGGGSFCFVVINKDEPGPETSDASAKLVEVYWPAGRTWEDAFR